MEDKFLYPDEHVIPLYSCDDYSEYNLKDVFNSYGFEVSSMVFSYEQEPNPNDGKTPLTFLSLSIVSIRDDVVYDSVIYPGFECDFDIYEYCGEHVSDVIIRYYRKDSRPVWISCLSKNRRVACLGNLLHWSETTFFLDGPLVRKR